jgi:hypothetical protein
MIASVRATRARRYYGLATIVRNELSRDITTGELRLVNKLVAGEPKCFCSMQC